MSIESFGTLHRIFCNGLAIKITVDRFLCSGNGSSVRNGPFQMATLMMVTNIGGKSEILATDLCQ